MAEIQDRRVTVPILGSLAPAFVDWSRLHWASPARVHEGLWRGPSSPTGYKVIAEQSACSSRPGLGNISASRKRNLVPTRSRLAPCSAPSRPLRAACGGGLRLALTAPARGARPALRVGTRKPPSGQQ